MRKPSGQAGSFPSWRGLGAIIFTLVLAVPLAACGPSEPDQRKAFIDFLKTRIVDKPGIHLPVPTDDERKSWGPYAAQFDVIARFHRGLDEVARKTFGDFNKLAMSARTIGSLLSQRSEVARIRDATKELEDTLKRQFEIADAARAAFPPQPEDLKAVYAAAYERDVREPAKFWMEAMPVLRQTLTTYLDTIDFIEQHKGSIAVTGITVTANDPKLMPRLNELLAAINANASKAAELHRAAQKMTYGR